ncbi:unnamed protein product [Arctogadus glacialis]
MVTEPSADRQHQHLVVLEVEQRYSTTPTKLKAHQPKVMSHTSGPGCVVGETKPDSSTLTALEHNSPLRLKRHLMAC